MSAIFSRVSTRLLAVGTFAAAAATQTLNVSTKSAGCEAGHPSSPPPTSEKQSWREFVGGRGSALTTTPSSTTPAASTEQGQTTQQKGSNIRIPSFFSVFLDSTQKEDLQRLVTTLDAIEHEFSSLAAADAGYGNWLTLPLLTYSFEQLMLRTPEFKIEVEHEANENAEEILMAPVQMTLVSNLQYYLQFADLAYNNMVGEKFVKLVQSTTRGDQWVVIETSTKTAVGIPSYFIAVDHTRKEVIVAVRGTVSPQDAITDLALQPVGFDYTKSVSLLKKKNSNVHSGINAYAEHLMNKSSHKLTAYAEQGYKLTFTGHSLGAAVAALSAIKMRTQLGLLEGLQVQCFGFATPACVGPKLASSSFAKNFITTVIHDDDVIPRVSLSNVATFRTTMCEYDWKSVTRRNLVSYFNGDEKDYVFQQLDGLLQNVPHTSPPVAELLNDVELCVPGKVIHLVRSPTQKYQMFSTEPQMFSHMKISQTMLSDHLLSSYEVALDAIANNWNYAPQSGLHVPEVLHTIKSKLSNLKDSLR
eukprot:m.110343 g.110343  ORF g.110343 m.110343 type:complete len:530 (-) comp28030_c0_seq1:91-1680(-)